MSEQINANRYMFLFKQISSPLFMPRFSEAVRQIIPIRSQRLDGLYEISRKEELKCRIIRNYPRENDVVFNGLNQEFGLSRKIQLHSLFQVIVKFLSGLKLDMVHSPIRRIQSMGKVCLKPSKDYIRKSQFIMIQNLIRTCRIKSGEIGIEITHRRDLLFA